MHYLECRRMHVKVLYDTSGIYVHRGYEIAFLKKIEHNYIFVINLNPSLKLPIP